MKALNPSTGNLETVYVKALDSMPVGAEINFDGQASDIPAGWEETDNIIYADDFKCKNLFNKNTVTSGYAVDGGNDGALVVSAGSNASDFIEVIPGGKYYLTKNPATGLSNCFYDSSKTFISAIYATDGVITIPDNPNIKYIRFNTSDSALDTTQFELGSTATSYVKHKDFENNEIYSINEVRIGTWINGKPLYRKIVEDTTSSTVTEKNITYASNVDICTKFDGYIEFATDSKIPINYCLDSTNFSVAYTDKSSDNGRIRLTTTKTSKPVTFIIEYTKTTD